MIPVVLIIGILLFVAVAAVFFWPGDGRMTPEGFEYALRHLFAREIANRELLVHLCEDDLIVRVRGGSLCWPKSSLHGAISDLAGGRIREVYELLTWSRASRE